MAGRKRAVGRRLESKSESFRWGRVVIAIALLFAVAGLIRIGTQTRILSENELSSEFELATRKLRAGDREGAKHHIERVVNGTSLQSPQWLFRCSQLYVDAGQFSDATMILERLDGSGQMGAESQFLRGAIALRQNRAAFAEEHWRRAVAIRENFTSVWERLSQLYMTQLRGADLRWSLEKLSQCRPLGIDELVVLSNAFEPYYSAEERLATVKTYFAADATDEYSLSAIAQYYLMNDQVAEAIQWLEKNRASLRNEITIAPHVQACLQIGVNNAIEAIEPWAALENPTPSVARARGLIAFVQGDWISAASNFRSAIKAYPDDSGMLYKLGQSLERLDRTSAADAAFKIVTAQENLKNLVFRIRKTTHLPIARLAPLIQEVVELLEQLKRDQEATMWMQLLDPAVGAGVEVRSNKSALEHSDRTGKLDYLEALAKIDRAELPSLGTSTKTVTQSEQATSVKSHNAAFVDCHVESGINFEYFAGGEGKKWLIETLGGGVAVLDFDCDGWPDLYFSQGCPISDGTNVARPDEPAPIDRLFRNLRNGRFEDVTKQAGLGDTKYSQGCSVGDFDNDGDPDLFVANFGENSFYVNNGDGTFSDESNTVGLEGDRWHTSAAFADLDNDGDLDLFVTTYVNEPFKVCRRPNGEYSACSPANYTGDFDVLYLNGGDGHFTDISESAGIRAENGKGLGVVIADFNNDSRPDIYVTNDGTPNFLFKNEGVNDSGLLKFNEVGVPAGCAVDANGTAQAGMGIACHDFNSDGSLDLFTTNFFNEGCTLYLNQGSGDFLDLTTRSGLREATRRMLGFGVQAIDFDLSENPGVFIANGHIDNFNDRNEPWKMRPQLFASNGQGHFEEISNSAGSFFAEASLGRAVSRLDFNRDLKPDLVVTYLDRPAAVLRNDVTGDTNAISLDLIGVQSNRDGRGCGVTISTGNRHRIYQLTSGDGYMATNERRMILGIGDSTACHVTLHWPSGVLTTIKHVEKNTKLTIVEGRPPILEH